MPRSSCCAHQFTGADSFMKAPNASAKNLNLFRHSEEVSVRKVATRQLI